MSRHKQLSQRSYSDEAPAAAAGDYDYELFCPERPARCASSDSFVTDVLQSGQVSFYLSHSVMQEW